MFRGNSLVIRGVVLYIPHSKDSMFFFQLGFEFITTFSGVEGDPGVAILGGSGPRTGPHTVARIHPH